MLNHFTVPVLIEMSFRLKMHTRKPAHEFSRVLSPDLFDFGEVSETCTPARRSAPVFRPGIDFVICSRSEHRSSWWPTPTCNNSRDRVTRDLLGRTPSKTLQVSILDLPDLITDQPTAFHVTTQLSQSTGRDWFVLGRAQVFKGA